VHQGLTPVSTPTCFLQNYSLMRGHKNSILEMHWTPDGDNLLTCSPDKTIRLWDAYSVGPHVAGSYTAGVSSTAHLPAL
jgi:WD40 repeat protein